MEKEARFTLTLITLALVLNFLVCFWDTSALNAGSWPYYYPFKIFNLSGLMLAIFLIWTKKIRPQTGYELTLLNMYLYGFIGTKYLHVTYIFTFYELMIGNALVYTGTLRRFNFLTLLGLAFTLISIHYMHEPDFIKEGFSIKGDIYVFTLILTVLTSGIYIFINRQKNMIYQLNERFSTVGKQATFLLHELKGPLSRFLANRKTENDKEAAHIYSIISSVESLVRDPSIYKTEFRDFQWESIQEYIEAEFFETCQQLGIKIEFSGMTGLGKGQITTLKLAIRNLVKNAIDAIMTESDTGTIRLHKGDSVLSISNTGKKILSAQSNKFFNPFKTTQATPENLGVGLHFVEHVINAHGGSISFESTDEGWNTFKVVL